MLVTDKKTTIRQNSRRVNGTPRIGYAESRTQRDSDCTRMVCREKNARKISKPSASQQPLKKNRVLSALQRVRNTSPNAQITYSLLARELSVKPMTLKQWFYTKGKKAGISRKSLDIAPSFRRDELIGARRRNLQSYVESLVKDEDRVRAIAMIIWLKNRGNLSRVAGVALIYAVIKKVSAPKDLDPVAARICGVRSYLVPIALLPRSKSASFTPGIVSDFDSMVQSRSRNTAAASAVDSAAKLLQSFYSDAVRRQLKDMPFSWIRRDPYAPKELIEECYTRFKLFEHRGFSTEERQVTLALIKCRLEAHLPLRELVKSAWLVNSDHRLGAFAIRTLLLGVEGKPGIYEKLAAAAQQLPPLLKPQVFQALYRFQHGPKLQGVDEQLLTDLCARIPIRRIQTKLNTKQLLRIKMIMTNDAVAKRKLADQLIEDFGTPKQYTEAIFSNRANLALYDEMLNPILADSFALEPNRDMNRYVGAVASGFSIRNLSAIIRDSDSSPARMKTLTEAARTLLLYIRLPHIELKPTNGTQNGEQSLGMIYARYLTGVASTMDGAMRQQLSGYDAKTRKRMLKKATDALFDTQTSDRQHAGGIEVFLGFCNARGDRESGSKANSDKTTAATFGGKQFNAALATARKIVELRGKELEATLGRLFKGSALGARHDRN